MAENTEKTLEQVALGKKEVVVHENLSDEEISQFSFDKNVNTTSHMKRSKDVVSFPNPDAESGYDHFLIQSLNAKERAIVNGSLVSAKKMQLVAAELMKENPDITDEELDAHFLENMTDVEVVETEAKKKLLTVQIGVRKPSYTLEELEDMKAGYVDVLYRKIERLNENDSNFRIPEVSNSSVKQEPTTNA